MRVGLVANRRSGKGTDASELEALLRAHGADVVAVRAPEDLADDEAFAGAERIVAAGGDGTVGPCASLAGRLGVPLAVVAIGTANDFARDHDLPREVEPACRLAATGTRTARHELARLEGCPARPDGCPFVNAASAGLAPVAARRARPFKPVLGPLAYAVGGLYAGLTAPRIDATLHVDGREVFSGPAWQVIVASTGAFGGGSGVEEADPHDGLLDVVAVPGGSRAGLPRRALGMRRHTVADQPGVVHEQGREVDLRLPAGVAINVDGELVESGDGALRVTIERGGFDLVVG